LNHAILIERLKSLGFKEYESKVLIVLLNGNPMSASEIAKEAGIIRNSIYDILKSFVEKGYCNEIETNTILNYQIIDPTIILDKIRFDYKKNFETRLENLNETFTELQTIYKTSSEEIEGPDKNIQLIRGFNKHRVAKILKLQNDAKFEILVTYGPRWAVNETASEDTKKFIKSGGAVRTIFQLSDDLEKNSESIKAWEAYEQAGEQIRLAKFNLTNIAIFDKETVFINLSNDKTIPKHKQADLIIKNTDFAVHIRDLFETYWERSITLEEFKIKSKNHGI
jgi:sugar-specific transcriptional regulator TrmB